MRPYDLIFKKREGEPLTQEEIRYLIEGYTAGDIPDYQMSAWAMAVFFKGMNEKETAELTLAMAESGEQIDLSGIAGTLVDKHSTGGVGDTTTLVLAPLVAAAGVPVPKMSGRGLGHTGGTIDKLESIPGFNTGLSREEFINQVNKIGVAIAGQTGNLAPADKKLYALRDVTATIDSIPLIASSIMSKKIAGGADGIVLDVKTGRGAFMTELKSARRLAQTMVNIGELTGKKTVAVITDMEQPLGRAVGNALEVIEAINTLKGEGPSDLEDLCLTLGAYMLIIAGRVDDYNQGYELLQNTLSSGEALKKFRSFVSSQGGNTGIVEDYGLLPQAKYRVKVKSSQTGFIEGIDSREVGLTAMTVGAGRSKKEDNIDHSVGVVLNKKRGDSCKEGELLAEIYLNNEELVAEATTRIRKAYKISEDKPEGRELIFDILD